MAKSKLGRYNPPGPAKEPGMMKVSYDSHFPGRITSMCKLDMVIGAIREKLTKAQLKLFKRDVFGHFLECRKYPFSGVIVHNLLLRQVAHEESDEKSELWFQIGEELIRLSIGEWCLVTGLKYGNDVVLKNQQSPHRLLNKYFNGLFRRITLGQFDKMFMELDFKVIDDIDALKIALFYFADRVLNGRKEHCQINFLWLSEVDEIDHFRKRPWGRLSWEIIYDGLDNALNGKATKFRTEHAEKPKHTIEKYNIYGFTSGVQAWIYECIGGLPEEWVVKIKRKTPRIVQWMPKASSLINYAEVYSHFNDNSCLEGNILQTLKPNAKERVSEYWLSVQDYVPYIPDWVRNHQPLINIPCVIDTKEESYDATRLKQNEQTPFEDENNVAEHDECIHNFDDAQHSEERTKFRYDYVIKRMDRIDRTLDQLKSDFEAERKEQQQFREAFQAERQEQQRYREAVMKFMASFGEGYTKRSYGDHPIRQSYTPTDDHGTYTDVRNDDDHTPMSLYSFFGDVNVDGVQIITEAPPGVSKFGRPYRPSYVFNSPFFIPPVKKVKNGKPHMTLEITEHEIAESQSIDINPLRGFDDPSIFAEFNQWFTGKITVDRTIQQSHLFFDVLLGNTSMGWLDDEHIHAYFRLVSKKQQEYPNALPQRVTHTDTFFWVFLTQLWNNGDCDIHSLEFSSNFNTYLHGREDIMSKRFTDVDVVLIPVHIGGDHWVLAKADLRNKRVSIYDSLVAFRNEKSYLTQFQPLKVIFPQWLEDIGFYNMRPELQTTDSWKIRIVKDVPQQAAGTGDCGIFLLMFVMYLMFGLKFDFDSSHVQYFRKKIALDIFNDDIRL